MIEKYEPMYMKKWTYPQYYFGEDYSEFYVFMSVTRDSDILEESNWSSFLRDYPENFDWDNKKGILIQRASHWACGWVDTIYIHEFDYEMLKICDEIYHNLQDYPVYDEEDYSRRECDAQYEAVNGELRYLANQSFYIEEDITDEQFEQMNYWFCQESNDMTKIPKEKDFEELYDKVLNYRICKKCRDLGRTSDYDVRYGMCDCQMKLF